MSDIFKKLNLKDESQIIVLNPPESFEPELAALKKVKVTRNLSDENEVTFSLAFVTKQNEVDGITRSIAPRVKGDALFGWLTQKGLQRNINVSLIVIQVGQS